MRNTLWISRARFGSKFMAAAVTVLAIGSVVSAAPAQAAPTKGSIAISRDGRGFAIATGYDSYEDAEQAAEQKCGPDCEWKTTWGSQYKCGAAAMAPNRHWGWARGNSQEEAEQNAINEAGPGAWARVSGCETITRDPA